MSDRVPPTDRSFHVVVRPKHFEEASPTDPNGCVIAQALRDTFPDLDGDDIYVGTGKLHLPADDDDEWPGSVVWLHDGRSIVRAFDQGNLPPHATSRGMIVHFTPRT